MQQVKLVLENLKAVRSYGWTWLPYESWGWAPSHYGRWGHAPALGW